MGLSLTYGSKTLDSSSSYNLSVVLSAEYISYVVFGTGNRIVKSNLVAYSNPNLEIEKIDSVLKSEGLDTGNFGKVNIGISSQDHNYVPTAEFESDKAAFYLNDFNNGRIINNKVLSDDLDKITNVYYAPRKLLSALSSKFPAAKIFHADTALFYGSQVSIQTGVIAHYLNDRLNVTVYKAGKFIFSNSYKCESDLASLFYITSGFEQANLVMHSMPLYLAGDFSSDDSKYKLLSTYIKNIEFMRCPVRFLENGKKNAHLYYQLYCLSKCG